MEIVSRFAVNSRQLDKLNGSSVHVVMNIDGELATLGPNPESSGTMWTAMRDMPPFQFYTSTSRSPRSHDGRDVLIRIRDQDRYFVGLRDPSPVVGPVALERIANHDVESDNKVIVDWELHADAESSTVRLFVPGTNRQLFPTFIGGNFTIAESNLGEGERPGPFRITPLCCPSPAPWPFVADDRTCSFFSICPNISLIFFSLTQLSNSRSSFKERLSRVHSSLHPLKPFVVVFNEPSARSTQISSLFHSPPI